MNHLAHVIIAVFALIVLFGVGGMLVIAILQGAFQFFFGSWD